jgi:two-component system, OmpR family, response regulator
MERVNQARLEANAEGAMSSRILLVEDDPGQARPLVKGLEAEGFELLHACSAEIAWELIQGHAVFDALVVDVMLPGEDGLSFIQRLRQAGFRQPVLLLSALGSVDDRVRGLRQGGDDYLAKPASLSELAVRLEVLLRRQAPPAQLRVGSLDIDCDSRCVHRDGKEVALNPREFRLLLILARQRGRTLSRMMLLRQVWDIDFDPGTSIVETTISRLRDKLGKNDEGALIRTVKGAGYVLDAE